MVTTREVVFVDDLDGSTDDVQPVWIGLDGVLVEVDLSAQHRRELLAALSPYLARGRDLLDDVDDVDDVAPRSAGTDTDRTSDRTRQRGHEPSHGPGCRSSLTTAPDPPLHVVLIDSTAAAAPSGLERHHLGHEMAVQVRLLTGLRHQYTQQRRAGQRSAPASTTPLAPPALSGRPAVPAQGGPPTAEHPDFPWIPFARARRELAQQIRAWAHTRGIPMPHRGTPASVLLAYRRAHPTEPTTP